MYASDHGVSVNQRQELLTLEEVLDDLPLKVGFDLPTCRL